MRSHRKGEPHVHARGVALDRRIEELLDLREGDDLVELPPDLRPRHAEDRTIEEDVLAARQLRVKARAHLEQARHAAADLDAPGARLGNPREDLQQRRLAGAIAPDDADHLATLDLEVDILERPELLDLVAHDELAAAHHVAGRAHEVPRPARDHVAQRDVALALALVADQVALAETIGADDDIGHQIRSANVFSVLRKWRMPSHSITATTARLARNPGI